MAGTSAATLIKKVTSIVGWRNRMNSVLMMQGVSPSISELPGKRGKKIIHCYFELLLTHNQIEFLLIY